MPLSPIKVPKDGNLYYHTKEGIQNSIYFPFEEAMRFGPKDFLGAWGHMEGRARLTTRRLNILSRKGLFKKISFTNQEILKLILSKIPQRLPKTEEALIRICEWCEGESFTLHRHHFPLPRSKGGTETVSICANCHSEFHHFQAIGHFVPTEYLQNLWDGAKRHKQEVLAAFEEETK